jgi:hypothetical protein
MKLADSILQHKTTKESLWCLFQGTERLATFSIRRQKHLKLTHYNDLLLTSPPGGYINYKQQALLVQRIPYRKYKIGLAQQNTAIQPLLPRGDKPSTTRERPRAYIPPLSFQHLVMLKETDNMIQNKYPTFSNAFDLCTESKKPMSVAFHRNWALQKDDLGLIQLFHFLETVGWFTPKSNKAYLGQTRDNKLYRDFLKTLGIDTYA